MKKTTKHIVLFVILLSLLVSCGKKNSSNTLSPTQIDRTQDEARNLFIDRKVKEALEGYKNVAQKAQQINYNQGLSNAYIGVANCYYELSNSNKGIKYLVLAEKHAQNNPEILARINMIKGFILVNAHSYDEAEKKFKIVIEFANQIKDQETAEMLRDRAYINIGNINFQLERYNLALTNYYKSYTSSDIVNRVASGINMADVFLQINQIDSAQKYLEAAQNNTYLIPEKKFRSAINEGLRGVKALYYIKEEDYKKAVNELKNKPSSTAFYTNEELLGMAYTKQHKTDSALFYFEKNIDNKLNSRLSDQNTFSATSLIYSDEKLTLQKKYEQKRKFYLSLISLTSLSCLLLAYTIYNRRKLNQQRTKFLESEKEKLRMEKEISDLKQQHYQEQLLAQSIQLDQKNKFLDELKENIKNNKDFNLNTYLKNEQLINKDLNNIQDIIKEVHPNFFKKLNDIAMTKLTNLDIKYAAYIYMNMDNSQIASISNVDPKTVSVTKYRLKQKLGLTKDIDLDTFIKKLCSTNF